MSQLRIASLDELEEGETVKFEFERAGRKAEGFLARFHGRYVAYENVCQHIAIPLDYGDDRFFTRDGTHFVCQTHGAVYEPLTGLCVRGPCEGEKLRPLKIVIRDKAIWLEE